MIKYLLLVTGLTFAAISFAQKTTGIRYTNTPPEIDGFIEDAWDQAQSLEKIDVPFKTEMATIGNSTWQGLYDDNNFYCVVFVDDDNHWPAWESGGNSWEYDKVEFYWDVNKVLDDGVGTITSNSGHYQFAPGFAEDSYDKTITVAQSAPGNLNPGGTYACSLIGEGYVYEIAVPLANLTDKEGLSFPTAGKEIGFDITVIDQDEGVTTTRQQMNWNNAGDIDEAWNNMDDAGTILFGTKGSYDYWGPYLRLSTPGITLTSKGESSDSVFVDIDGNNTWTVESDQSWLVVSPTSHIGDGMITVIASENNGKRRTAKVNFILPGDGYYSFIVTQLASEEVGVPGINTKKLTISPNPSSDWISIQGGIDRVVFYNCQGMRVKETMVSNKTISLSGLSNGIYIIKAYKEGQLDGMAKVIKD